MIHLQFFNHSYKQHNIWTGTDVCELETDMDNIIKIMSQFTDTEFQ